LYAFVLDALVVLEQAEIKLKANYQIYVSDSLPLSCHASQFLVCSCISAARMITLSASPGVLNMSHPSLVIYWFATPPGKLKLGQPIGGGLLIANHVDQSL
jgi:hypothetical protein